MNGQRFLTVLLALCTVVAVGISATTLEESLETDPDSVIDFEYSNLPIGKESVREVKRESLRNERSTGGSASPERETGGNSLPDVLGPLLAVLAVLVALALVYRYRERILAAVLAGRGWLADRSSTVGSATEITWPRRQPSNDVHRAWLAMVERANPDQPWSRTPAECARAAVDAGMDSESVATLTNLFEEVRYGDAPLTDERRRQAREWLQRLDRRGDGQP